MKGTMQKFGNSRNGNGRYDGSKSRRDKQRSHLKIPKYSSYIEEPRTNDIYFRSNWDDLPGILGVEKYDVSGGH